MNEKAIEHNLLAHDKGNFKYLLNGINYSVDYDVDRSPTMWITITYFVVQKSKPPRSLMVNVRHVRHATCIIEIFEGHCLTNPDNNELFNIEKKDETL